MANLSSHTYNIIDKKYRTPVATLTQIVSADDRYGLRPMWELKFSGHNNSHKMGSSADDMCRILEDMLDTIKTNTVKKEN